MLDKLTTKARELLAFLDRSPTAYQATANCQAYLEEQGFIPYEPGTALQPGDRCFKTIGLSGIFAFKIGQKPLQAGLRIVGTHNDAPALSLKPNSTLTSEGCLKLSTEIYGGPILHTWFDRPLSLAGRVVLAGSSLLQPQSRLVDLQEPLAVIPSAAIHMNRTVNESNKIEPQKMLLPLVGTAGSSSRFFIEELLAEKLAVAPEAILDYDLFFYDNTPGTLFGPGQDLLLAPHLDNLGMSYAAVTALAAADVQAGISLVACFDHEEVGSRTRQGALSTALANLLESLTVDLGGSRMDMQQSLARSFLISADQAHAVHPNFPEFADATNRPRLNGGPVIKRSASRSYTSDGETAAVFMALCEESSVPCQSFVNRSDMRGGSTIGPLFVQNLPIRAVDVGNPILGMHSIRETGGSFDHAAMTKVMTTFFSLPG